MSDKITWIIIFLILGSCVIANVLYINLTTNTVYATFSLIVVFLLSAVILLLLGVEFLGLVYITVYVGAISVFFIFILMLFDLRIVSAESAYKQQPNGEGVGYFIPATFAFILFIFFDSIFFYSFFYYKKYSDLVFLKYIFDNSTHEEFAALSSTDLRTLVTMYNKEFDKLSESERSQIYKVFTELKESDFAASSTTENVMTSIEQIKYTALQNIGSTLYNEHFGSFVVITLVLLIALVGAMAIAMNFKNKKKD